MVSKETKLKYHSIAVSLFGILQCNQFHIQAIISQSIYVNLSISKHDIIRSTPCLE